MSVYVVNVKEPDRDNKTLHKLKDIFKGNIFYQDAGYGCIMVDEQKNVTADQQRDSVRKYFAEHAIPVLEMPNETGHVIFEVDLTSTLKKQAATDAVEFQPAGLKPMNMVA